jgi:prophage maintenance system killer protein
MKTVNSSQPRQLTEAQQYYIGLFERWQKMSKDERVKVDNPELWGKLQLIDFKVEKQILEYFEFDKECLLVTKSIYELRFSGSKETAWMEIVIFLASLDSKLREFKFYNTDLKAICFFDQLNAIIRKFNLEKKIIFIKCQNYTDLENQQLKNELNNLTSPVIKNEKGEIIIYQNPNGAIEVNLKNGQLWLNQKQIATIFDVNQPAISKHIKNILETQELKLEQVHSILEYTANDGKVYSTNFYNLDMILSIGYRVNSKIATKFRQWANTVLKDYITKGYSINQNRLAEIKQDLRFLIDNKSLLSEDTFEVLLGKYTDSLVTLNQFDENKIPEVIDEQTIQIEMLECLEIIAKTKKELMAKDEAWEGFGKELDNKFVSTIGALNQTFGGNPVYNRSQKLANLLYLTVKNHSFVDGNKRIGAILFTYFCSKSGFIIDPNNLITLTLFVAQSNPNDKENLIKLIQVIIK